MKTADIDYNASAGQFEVKLDGAMIARSKNLDYLVDRIALQDNVRITKAGITNYRLVGSLATGTDLVEMTQINIETQPVIPSAQDFDINQRFGFVKNLTEMLVKKLVNSVLIAGKGGIGKTKSVIQVLESHNLTNCDDFVQPEKIKKTEGESDDENDDQVAEKWTNPGDYLFIKGYSTAKALYRTLYENNGKIIIFDDCDSIHKIQDAINLLKGALDTYDRRIISWNAEPAFGGSDLPLRFEFTGQIIFLTNLEMSRVNEAVRTRAFCVDLSVTKQQMMDRILMVLSDVMPEVEMDIKKEVYDFLESKLHVTAVINFRLFMSLIKIRLGSTGNDDWKNLAEYVLAQQSV